MPTATMSVVEQESLLKLHGQSQKLKEEATRVQRIFHSWPWGEVR
jgi:hypothetical protein